MDKCSKSIYLQEYLIILVLLTRGTKEEKKNAKNRLLELEKLISIEKKCVEQARSNLGFSNEEYKQISIMQLGVN